MGTDLIAVVAVVGVLAVVVDRVLRLLLDGRAVVVAVVVVAADVLCSHGIFVRLVKPTEGDCAVQPVATWGNVLNMAWATAESERLAGLTTIEK